MSSLYKTDYKVNCKWKQNSGHGKKLVVFNVKEKKGEWGWNMGLKHYMCLAC